MQKRMVTRRWVRRLLVPILILTALLAQAAPTVRADDPRAELNKQQDKLKYIQERKRSAQNDLERINWEAEEAEAQLVAVEGDLNLANSQLVVIQAQLKEAEADLKKVEGELKQAEENYARRKAYLATRVRAINDDGRVSYLAVLMGARSFIDFISRFDMLKLVVQKDSELFAQIREDKAVLEQRTVEATTRRNHLVTLKAQGEERRTTIETKRTERVAVSRELDSKKRELQAQLTEFDRQEELVQQQIIDIQRRMNRAAGKFVPIYPVKKPVNITDSFGPRLHPILRVWRPHNGTDFAANTGDPVYAVEAGVVIVAGWNDAYGNLVVIDHGGGVSSWYGHSSRLLVREGETVQQGQQISRAGSTGWSTGPHVHLELRFNGRPEDPLNYIR